MRVRDFIIRTLFASVLFLSAPVFAVDISGKITAVSGSSITIKADSTLLPNVGDKVDVSFKTPDGEEIPVGVWRVSKVEGESIEATVVESSGDPNVDMNAVIHSDQPRALEVRNPEPRPGGTSEAAAGKRIASLNAKFSNLRFYESKGDQLLPFDQRNYRDSFEPNSVRIWFEFTLDYNTSQRVDFNVVAKYFKADGSLFGETNFSYYLNPLEKQTLYTSGYKPLQGGWPAGRYTVDLHVNGAKEASGSFVVGGPGGGTAGNEGGMRKLSSLNATLTQIRFYESKTPEMLPNESRIYRDTFDRNSQYIWWEFHLEYQTSRRVDFTAVCRFLGPSRELLHEDTNHFYLNPAERSTWYTDGFKMSDGWPPGAYTVHVLINGVKEISGSFQVR